MKKEKVIIVHLNRALSEDLVESKLLELKELVRSSGGEVIAELVQNANKINPAFYIGKGKVDEIKDLAEKLEADAIIFNNELTGSQMKNLEDVIDKKIVDRTGLILDIFALRAKTKEGKLQVKLAQLEYRLPRLVGFRNYLSREGAGIGTRGPGEQKLEVDRRTVQREISSIKKQLEVEKRRRHIKSKRRAESSIPLLSLIGYSNAGKSTILNSILGLLSENKKKVYSDDMLFATLDVSARKINLENGRKLIIADTVGFISDLPTKLVESFKSTLEEVAYSDLILIVVDASNADYKMQLEATNEVLEDMNLSDKKILYVFNKIDKGEINYIDHKEKEIIKISALNDGDIYRLLDKITSLIFYDYAYYDIIVAYDAYEKIREFTVKNKEDQYLDSGIKTKIFIKKSEFSKYEKYMVKYGIQDN